MTALKCRSCASISLQDRGALPDGVAFAGRRLSSPLPGGRLYACRECGFVFRDPIPAPEVLAGLYANGTSDVWSDNQGREDFRLIREFLATRTSVLDVGCFAGDMLAPLTGLRRYGVEPNKAAADIARARGVEILAGSVAEARQLGMVFDVVTACDVIEHVPDPSGFVDELWSLVGPSGSLLLSTGTPDSALWRLLGARFWYCYFPEHISFISRRWMERYAVARGVPRLEHSRFNYLGTRQLPARRLLKLAAALAYGCAPRTYQRLMSRVGSFSPPGCGASEDHAIYLLHKS